MSMVTDNKVEKEIIVSEVAVGSFTDKESGDTINYQNLKELFMGGISTPQYKIANHLVEGMTKDLGYGVKVKITMPLKIVKDKWVLGEIVAYEVIK